MECGRHQFGTEPRCGILPGASHGDAEHAGRVVGLAFLFLAQSVTAAGLAAGILMMVHLLACFWKSFSGVMTTPLPNTASMTWSPAMMPQCDQADHRNVRSARLPIWCRLLKITRTVPMITVPAGVRYPAQGLSEPPRLDLR